MPYFASFVIFERLILHVFLSSLLFFAFLPSSSYVNPTLTPMAYDLLTTIVVSKS